VHTTHKDVSFIKYYYYGLTTKISKQNSKLCHTLNLNIEAARLRSEFENNKYYLQLACSAKNFTLWWVSEEGGTESACWFDLSFGT